MIATSSLNPARLIAAAALAFGLTAAPAEAATPEDARALIRSLEREAILMGTGSLTMPEKKERFRALLNESFDMPAIVRFILGRHWRPATPAQRAEFAALFEHLMIDTWVGRLDEFDADTRIQVLSVTPTPDGFRVATAIPREGGRPASVVWRMIDSPAGLKVVDIVAEGVSMAERRREELASFIRMTGGMDGLLGAMRVQLAGLTN